MPISTAGEWSYSEKNAHSFSLADFYVPLMSRRRRRITFRIFQHFESLRLFPSLRIVQPALETVVNAADSSWLVMLLSLPSALL